MNTSIQVDLYAAISLDGYIARTDGTTDWTKDDAQFEALCREYRCIVMGRSTYDEFEGPAFEGIENLILTHTPKDNTDRQGVHFVASPQEAIALAQEMHFDKLLVIGGAGAYASFADSASLHTVRLDIHSLFLGEGLKLFGDYNAGLQLRFESAEQQADYMHTIYTVKKSAEQQ